ncbi:MAG: methyltransferase [Acidobacteria bacterium]|nr:MAG: methyltransferase [Acidobacteriota bacterium]TLY18445.1 MAG: class I SAM-dependent rRNA methyltransferase [Nitrospirota bacterium]
MTETAGPTLPTAQIVVRKRGADRIRRGHLWIYRSDVLNPKEAEPGSVVAVRNERGAVLGKAFFSSQSQISLRFLSRGDVAIDEAFFHDRFAAADVLRQRLGVDPLLSRRIYTEGDLLPGLIVDRYRDRLVVQSLIQATDRLQPLVTRILMERYQPRSILFRNDSRVRELEGLELKQEVVGEPVPETLVANEDEKEIEISLTSGQKTGSYLDQRDNHRAARRYARGRALDAFSYAGGFAVQIADRCEHVEAVDISAEAVSLARSNAGRNGLTNVECIEANAFDFLRERHKEGRRYDTIILDPPAFAKNKESLEGALRGYKEINNRAMRLLRPGGILITCSCSHHVSEGIFAEMLADAAKDAGCWARVLERRTQAADHPILLTVPETLYLKCFILEIRY